LELLQIFGYVANKKKDYTLTEAKSSHEIAGRAEAAREFRRFYDELKKSKEDSVAVIEYCLSVRIRNIYY
jgi:hypothetical protein